MSSFDHFMLLLADVMIYGGIACLLWGFTELYVLWRQNR